MTRAKSQTIGVLGRSPARTTKDPFNDPPPPPHKDERGQVRRWLHGALFDNVGLKFLSMVLAVTVFLLVNTDRENEITVTVGVSYTLPDDKVLTSPRLDEVHVTIRGPSRRVRRFDPREIERVDLDLHRGVGGEIAITKDMVHLPANSGLQIVDISPRTVQVVFDKRVEKIVEVVPQVGGHPPHGYVVASIKAKPTTIKVRGAEHALTLSQVRTREVTLKDQTEDFDADAEIVAPEGVELDGPPLAQVHIAIDLELVTRKLPTMTVALKGDEAGKWAVSPAQVEVTLTGSLLTIENAKEAMTPIVKVVKDDKEREAQVSLDGLPPGIGAKISPERVKLVPAKQDKP